jgi:ankyrin repeat protein
LFSANKSWNQDLSTGELVHCAVGRCGKEHNLEVLDTLIRAGAPADNILWDQPPAYNTKAHFRRGTPLHEACKHGYTEMADMLMTNGANPHKETKRYRRAAGETPYKIAAKKIDIAMLEIIQRHVSVQSPLCSFGRPTNTSVPELDQV